MSAKQDKLAALQEEFQRWEELLASLPEAQITTPQLSADLSIKDVIGHLHAWQQLSIARLEAAQHHQEPVMPAWVTGPDPDAEEALEQFNATIHATYQSQPWLQVYGAWREGFLRCLQLGEAIPENDLTDAQKYPWLKGYSLLAVLEGSYEHHREHYEDMTLERSIA